MSGVVPGINLSEGLLGGVCSAETRCAESIQHPCVRPICRGFAHWLPLLSFSCTCIKSAQQANQLLLSSIAVSRAKFEAANPQPHHMYSELSEVSDRPESFEEHLERSIISFPVLLTSMHSSEYKRWPRRPGVLRGLGVFGCYGLKACSGPLSD